MLLALLSLAVLSQAPCDSQPADSAITAVRRSRAFEQAVAIQDQADSAHGWVGHSIRPDAFCHMWVQRLPVLGAGRVLVRFDNGEQDMALMDAIFGVEGNRVVLLNGVSERGLEARMNVKAWNRFIDRRLTLVSDSARIAYAFLVGALYYNYSPTGQPRPLCATDSTVVVHRPSGVLAAYFDELMVTVVARSNGQVDSVVSGRRLTSACSGGLRR